jgi:hypothetical protein
MKVLAGVMSISAAIGFGWVFSLPSKEQCRASGRVVDPTERHCLDGAGYQQLEEHALFHSTEVVAAVAAILAITYSALWLYRRWSRSRLSSRNRAA